MAEHHIVPRFLIRRWKNDNGRVTLADIEQLVVRDTSPKHLDTHRDFNRLAEHGHPEALENLFFSRLESDAARAVRQLVSVRPPPEHIPYARANGYRPGQLIEMARAVRFAQFMAAQVVRSPDWRKESNTHTAAMIAEEIETKVRANLRATQDPAEIQRLEDLLGLRYQAIAEGDMLPQLSADLTTRIGEVLFTKYLPTVVRLPAPVLCLGNDPVIFLDRDPEIGFGSYSQIASRRGNLPFSVRRDIDNFLTAAVDVARGHRLIALPLDPHHAIVLHPVERPRLPGMYREDVQLGQMLNAAAVKASRRWLVVPPGRREAAREVIYMDSPQLRRLDQRRAAKNVPLFTDPADGLRSYRPRSSPRSRLRSISR